MKFFGWALALAAAAMVPTTALAQSDINRGTTDVSELNPNQAEPAPLGEPTPSSTSATTSAQPGEAAPTAQAAAPVPGTTGHAIPTPGIGIPDGRMGLQ